MEHMSKPHKNMWSDYMTGPDAVNPCGGDPMSIVSLLTNGGTYEAELHAFGSCAR